MIESFHFLRPAWLLALLPLLGMLWRLHQFRSPLGQLSKICDPALLPYLAIAGNEGQRPRGTLATTALAGILAIVALAGPVWDRVPVPAFRNENALAIVLDLSMPMDASDIKPSRLDRARYKIADLLRARRDGQTALVVYAGDAFTVTPLTDDGATIASQLGALGTQLSPVAGQRADLGIELAVRLMTQTGLQTGDVLLMASAADETPAVAAAEHVAAAGFRLSVLGVGTAAGGPVPQAKGGLWKDQQGNILVPKLDAAMLRRLAEAGGGRYRDISSDASDVDALLAFFDRPRTRVPGSSNSQALLEQWVERGPWLLLALLPIAALAFRRGVLLILPLLMIGVPRPAAAFEWEDLWSKPDQRAAKAFADSRYDEAARRFGDRAWQGTAWYRAGDYQRALQSLKGIETADGWYNQGNALAQIGKFPEAIAAYQKALEKDPGHADAKYNKELVENAMKKKPEKKSDPSSKGKGAGQQQKSPNNEGKDAKDKQPDQGEQQKPDSGQDDREASDTDTAKGSNPNEPDSAPRDRSGQKSDAGAEPVQQAPEGQEPQATRSAENLPNEDPKKPPVRAETETSEQREEQQANEQWLRRIPDDPAGLLRRKFAWQHRQRQIQQQENGE